MIKLEPFKEEDIDQLISWVTDEKFLLMFAGPKYKINTLREQLLEDIKESEKDFPKILLYKVVNIPDGQTIGHVQLVNIDWEIKKATVGRVLIGNQNMQGKGIGKEIMKQILRIGFEKLNLKEINLNVFHFNTPAIKCYEKVGFEVKEVKENVVQIDNEYWSTISMTITVKKYRRVKGEY